MPDLKTRLEEQRAMLLKKAGLMIAHAEREARALTEVEEATHVKLLADIEALDGRIDRAQSDASIGAVIDGLMPAMLNGQPMRPGSPGALASAYAAHAGLVPSLGAQFVAGDLYKWLKASNGRRPAGNWSSPQEASSELHLTAATLTQDPASGGDLILPTVMPGIVPLPTRPLTIAALLAQGQTTSNTVVSMRETTFVPGADTVAEGAEKPEATLAFDAVADPVRKIAVWLPVSDEMLEDEAQIRSYIDSRLRLAVDLALDFQCLSGSTTPPDIVGILNRTGLAPALPMGTDTPVDALAKQGAAIQTATNLPISGYVIHPDDWLLMRLSKTETGGDYLGSGPFEAPTTPTLWGIPVSVTPLITKGTALVGAFRDAAQLFRRGGIRVEASSSHSDFWIRNLTAVRAETRVALVVTRPSAFGLVTGIA